MSQASKCEYCDRPIVDEPLVKVLRGEPHTFCSAFCSRLSFYDAPKISYDDLQKMYAHYCVSVPLEEFEETLKEMTPGEDR